MTPTARCGACCSREYRRAASSPTRGTATASHTLRHMARCRGVPPSPSPPASAPSPRSCVHASCVTNAPHRPHRPHRRRRGARPPRRAPTPRWRRRQQEATRRREATGRREAGTWREAGSCCGRRERRGAGSCSAASPPSRSSGSCCLPSAATRPSMSTARSSPTISSSSRSVEIAQLAPPPRCTASRTRRVRRAWRSTS